MTATLTTPLSLLLTILIFILTTTTTTTASITTPPLTITPEETLSTPQATITTETAKTPYTITQMSTTTTATTAPSSSFNARKLSDVMTNRRQAEGVGVYVKRSIGSGPEKSLFGPFALLDHFTLDEGALERGSYFAPHPHRGIATVTYILPNDGKTVIDNGGVQHRDHLGHRGIIGPGDIQYMSAGRGICHSETSTPNPNGLSKRVDGLQLWLNLRKEDKMSDPEYQEYRSAELPVVERDGINAKVIMGTALGVSAKVKTKTPVHYIHYKLQPNVTLQHPLPPHWATFAYAFNGSAVSSDGKDIKQGQTAYYELGLGSKASEASSNNYPFPQIDQNNGISLTAGPDGFDFVLISGEPLLDGAPVARHGPVIMNSNQELNEFFQDYRNGRNGFEGSMKFSRDWDPFQ